MALVRLFLKSVGSPLDRATELLANVVLVVFEVCQDRWSRFPNRNLTLAENQGYLLHWIASVALASQGLVVVESAQAGRQDPLDDTSCRSLLAIVHVRPVEWHGLVLVLECLGW